jgi:hypothetical protein
VQTNIEITAFNEAQSLEAAAALSVWENRRTQREQSQRDWDNRRNKIKSEKLNEDMYMGCGGCGTNRGCDSGWKWHRNNNGCNGLGCEQVCRRDDNTAQREADDQTRNERGDRPGDFNEAKPEDKKGDFYHKDTMPINSAINCCANIANINGDVSNFAQRCSQQITQQIALANAPAPAPANAPAPAPANAPAPAATDAPLDTVTGDDEPAPDNTYLIGGGFGAILLSSCCIFLLLIVFFLI